MTEQSLRGSEHHHLEATMSPRILCFALIVAGIGASQLAGPAKAEFMFPWWVPAAETPAPAKQGVVQHVANREGRWAGRANRVADASPKGGDCQSILCGKYIVTGF